MKMKRIRRMDVQVSILTALIVIFSCTSIFAFHYHLTYQDMIRSLHDRVYSIYEYIESSIDKASFYEIDSKAEQSSPLYTATKERLERTRASTGVRYLYTAKKKADGSFVYVVDGLPSDAEDFRNAGDPIEPEIYSDMQRALDGEVVLPSDIKETDWGKIFITYFPIHEGRRIVGVLGIEFEAEHQYNTYRLLRISAPIITLLACLISITLAIILFRRISNPTYQDFSNTDHLTGLKNRNAYDTDMKNCAARRQCDGVGVIIIDLNNLKLVNDELGHPCGDRYLQSAAGVLRSLSHKGIVPYRIGGDEFAVLYDEADEGALMAFCKKIQQGYEPERPSFEVDTSLAIGTALYSPKLDENLYDTVRRADCAMYQDKGRARKSDAPQEKPK